MAGSPHPLLTLPTRTLPAAPSRRSPCVLVLKQHVRGRAVVELFRRLHFCGRAFAELFRAYVGGRLCLIISMTPRASERKSKHSGDGGDDRRGRASGRVAGWTMVFWWRHSSCCQEGRNVYTALSLPRGRRLSCSLRCEGVVSATRALSPPRGRCLRTEGVWAASPPPLGRHHFDAIHAGSLSASRNSLSIPAT